MQTKESNDVNSKQMSVNIADEDSLLLLLRDAIVQHMPLKDIKRVLRYLTFIVAAAIDFSPLLSA